MRSHGDTHPPPRSTASLHPPPEHRPSTPSTGAPPRPHAGLGRSAHFWFATGHSPGACRIPTSVYMACVTRDSSFDAPESETVCRLRQISAHGNACAILFLLTPPAPLVWGCLPGSRCGAQTRQGDVSTDFRLQILAMYKRRMTDIYYHTYLL